MSYPSLFLRVFLTLTILWAMFPNPSQECHSKKKTPHQLTRTLKFIDINFDEYEDDDDDKLTKKLDYCAHEPVKWSPSMHDYFQANDMLRKILDEGADEPYLEVLEQVQEQPDCQLFAPICSYFSWCVFCYNHPGAELLSMCKILFGLSI